MFTPPETFWRFATPANAANSSPAVVNGKVFFGTADGTFYCLKQIAGANGELLWLFRLGDKANGSMITPAVDGVKLLCCGQNLKLSKDQDGIRLKVESHGQGYEVLVDQLLVAVGRAPNVEGLGLETVGVEFDKKGVKVNDRLQTANPRIYACGDICSPYQFTHAADFMARIVIQNALFKGRAKASSLIIPWATYTSPEIAHVGLDEKDAKDKGIEVDTFTQELSKVDRAILDGETEGFVRVHVRKGTGEIVGGTVVAAHAGDLIGELTLAMKGKLHRRVPPRSVQILKRDAAPPGRAAVARALLSKNKCNKSAHFRLSFYRDDKCATSNNGRRTGSWACSGPLNATWNCIVSG